MGFTAGHPCHMLVSHPELQIIKGRIITDDDSNVRRHHYQAVVLDQLCNRFVKMSAALHRVFVYGTLKRGQPNYHLLTDPSKGASKWLGAAKLEKRYPLVVASQFNVPFLLDQEGEGKVRNTLILILCVGIQVWNHSLLVYAVNYPL